MYIYREKKIKNGHQLTSLFRCQEDNKQPAIETERNGPLGQTANQEIILPQRQSEKSKCNQSCQVMLLDLV